MKKQFEIIEQLSKLSQETNQKISALRKHIEDEHNKLKSALLNAYDNDADVMYLVDFREYFYLKFYKATKENLVELSMFFDSETDYKRPKTFEEAEELLKTYKTMPYCTRNLDLIYDASKYKPKMDKLVEKTLVSAYPPLHCKNGGITAQYEHTIYLSENNKIIFSESTDY